MIKLCQKRLSDGSHVYDVFVSAQGGEAAQ